MACPKPKCQDFQFCVLTYLTKPIYLMHRILRALFLQNKLMLFVNKLHYVRVRMGQLGRAITREDPCWMTEPFDMAVV